MSLLDDETIRIYFNCPLPECRIEFPIRRCVCIGDHVLQGMQETIKAGDFLAYVSSTGNVTIERAKTDGSDEMFHPYAIRLPEHRQTICSHEEIQCKSCGAELPFDREAKCCEYEKALARTKDGAVYAICGKHLDMMR